MIVYFFRRLYLEEDTITAIQYKKQALDLIEEINADNAQLVSNLYANIAANFREIGDKQLAISLGFTPMLCCLQKRGSHKKH